MPLRDIPRAVRNPKDHDLPAIRTSIEKFGCLVAGELDERTGRLVAGHGRLEVLEAMCEEGADPPQGIERVDPDDAWRVPIVRGWSSRSDAEAEAYIIAANRIPEKGGWEQQLLAEILDDIAAASPDLLELTGYTATDLDDLVADLDARSAEAGKPTADAFDLEAILASDKPTDGMSLAERFLIPPFTVLDARSGWWRDRKRSWLNLGIKSEVGRTARTYNMGFSHDEPHDTEGQGISVFDPVLCELAYRWFSPPRGQVVDPFAGGSVRGIVAASLGRSYLGIDLSETQVEANREQVQTILRPAAASSVDNDGAKHPQRAPGEVTYRVGDSRQILKELPGEFADMIFSCPPYLWLERYSEDPADLSTMTEDAFADSYADIIAEAARVLRPNRFAVLVVGDVRHPRTGRLVDLRGITIRAAEAGGLTLQSTAILATPLGSVALRTGPQFVKSRLLGRAHQDVLAFVKGERQMAADACGPVEVTMPDVLENQEIQSAEPSTTSY